VLVIDAVVSRLPRPVRTVLYRHAELLKFAVVGGTTFVIDTTIFVGLKHSVLETKPVISKIIATLVATIVSYVLSREWSFRTRGGRAGHHEAMLFFVISGIGVVLTSAPLWLSRYAFGLQTPNISAFSQEIADFVSAQIIGTLVAMLFRWWAFRKYVFPHADARPRIREDQIDITAAELLGDVWPVIDEPDDMADSDKLRDTDDTEDPLATR
jgi:putative flippase GtrA